MMLRVASLLYTESASRVMPRVFAALLRDAAGRLPLVAIFDVTLHTGIMPIQLSYWRRALLRFLSVNVVACMYLGLLLARGIIAPSTVAKAPCACGSEQPLRMPVVLVKWFSRYTDSLFLR